MAVTFLDTPNVPISQRETLDFISDTLPLAVSISFSRARVMPEERAFRDGIFLYPYLTSTVEGSGPYTFHLRRSGGWADDTELFVDEAPAPPSGAATWQVLYNVDFTALPFQGFGGFGANTIDGLTWYLKPGRSGASPMTLAINPVAGRGIQFDLQSTGGVAEASDSFFGPRLLLPLASIPNFNPNAPVVFYVRTDGAGDAGCAVCGVMDCALNTNQPTTVEWQRRQAISRDGSSPGAGFGARNHFIWQHAGNTNASSPSALGVSEVQGGRVIRVLDQKTVAFGAFDWSGATPDPTTGAIYQVSSGNSMSYLSLNNPGSGELFRDMSNLSFCVAYNNQSNAQSWASLKQLTVWQPGV